MSKVYYTYRHIVSKAESKHYLTPGAAKGALTTLVINERWYGRTMLKSDFEIVAYECIEVAVTQLQ